MPDTASPSARPSAGVGRTVVPCQVTVWPAALAALICAGKVTSLKDGAALAAESIDSGNAAAKVSALRRISPLQE